MATVALTDELERAWLVSPTRLGCLAVLFTERGVARIAFGSETPREALAKLSGEVETGPWLEAGPAERKILRRLESYLRGADDDLLDIAVDTSNYTAFQQAVVHHCRRIPRGETLSYGDLAAKAGSPRAARAVGNIMAGNRFPLVVPCHRVVGSNSWGGYSAADGLQTKFRLLALEGAIDEAEEPSR